MDNNYDILTDDIGITRYFKKGTEILHRLDGPARIFHNGDVEYWVNGQLHREKGPARIWFKGKYQVWCRRGLYHRIDGPAVIRTDGTEEYWIDGKEATDQEISLIKMIYGK